jgi:hypothetical protein
MRNRPAPNPYWTLLSVAKRLNPNLLLLAQLRTQPMPSNISIVHSIHVYSSTWNVQMCPGWTRLFWDVADVGICQAKSHFFWVCLAMAHHSRACWDLTSTFNFSISTSVEPRFGWTEACCQALPAPPTSRPLFLCGAIWASSLGHGLVARLLFVHLTQLLTQFSGIRQERETLIANESEWYQISKSDTIWFIHVHTIHTRLWRQHRM